ncbi:MAG TPA: J domain-containing protein, partial [Acidimicrobiales bacterium]
ARYDRYGPEGVFGSQPGGMGGFGFEGGLGDIFEAFFGQMGGNGGRRRGPQAGADAEVRLDLEFAEAVFGCHKEISVRLPATCNGCAGRGTAPGTDPETCVDCQGAGELRRVRQSILGQVMTASPCGRCQGTGSTIASPCPTCRGDGRTVGASTLVVDVPAGVEDGSTMRLVGRGAAGFRGGPSGTLYVHLGVERDTRFERHGDDLHTVATVSLAQAALGTTVDIPTLEGDEPIEIARGTQPGTVVRLRQRGVTHLRGRGRGDLHVHVAVDVPTELDEESESILRSLAAHRSEDVAPPHTGLLSRLRSRR